MPPLYLTLWRRHSPLTTHHLRFTIYDPRLTIHDSQRGNTNAQALIRRKLRRRDDLVPFFDFGAELLAEFGGPRPGYYGAVGPHS